MLSPFPSHDRMTARLEPLVELLPTIEALEGRTLADSAALTQLQETHGTRLTEYGESIQSLIESRDNLNAAIDLVRASVDSHSSRLTELSDVDANDTATLLALITALQNKDSEQAQLLGERITSTAFYEKVQEIETNQQTYLKKSGGTFNGRLVIENNDTAVAGIDFTSSAANSRNAIQFQTYGGDIATIGSEETPRQFAISTAGNQEFAVVNDGTKQLSVTKDGVYASSLFVADFNPNTDDGLSASNIIDVKERLTKYQTAFEEIRSSIATVQTFDEYKTSLIDILSRI